MTPTPHELTVDRVAQAMYDRVKASLGAKELPERFTELEKDSVERYRLLAGAAVEALPYPADLLDDLAWQLAYKYDHPGRFVDSVRETFENYVNEVGEDFVDPMIKECVGKW